MCIILCYYVLKEEEHLILPKGLVLVSHEPSIVNTEPGPHIRGNTLRAYSMGDSEVDLLLPGTARYNFFRNFTSTKNKVDLYSIEYKPHLTSQFCRIELDLKFPFSWYQISPVLLIVHYIL